MADHPPRKPDKRAPRPGGVWLAYLDHPWLTLLVIGVVTLFLGTQAARVPFDTSLESLVVENDPDRVFFEQLEDHFDTGEFVVVALEGQRIFTHDNLTLLAQLTNHLAAIDGVDETTSLTNVEDIVGDEESFTVGPFLEEIPKDEEALRRLRMRATDKPLYRGALISKDAKTGSVIVELTPHLQGKDHQQVIDAIRDDVEREGGGRTHLAGKPVMDHYTALFMRLDLQRFIPLTVALMAIILWVLLRNGFGAVLPLIAMGLCLVWSVGVLGLLGGTINNITTILPPVMMALTVSVAIHLLSTYQDNLASARFAAPPEGVPVEAEENPDPSTHRLMASWFGRLRGDPSTPAPPPPAGAASDLAAWSVRLGDETASLAHNREVIVATIRELWKPCVIVTLTTVAGFISLVVSDIPPMRHFGVSAAIGMLFSLLIAFTLLPACWLLVRRPVARRHNPLEPDLFDELLLRLGGLVTHQPRRIILVAILAAILAAIGVLRLRVETNLLEYFDKETTLVRDTLYVEHNLAGVEDVRISLRADEPDGILTLDTLHHMEALVRFLEQQPGVDRVTSLLDYLKEMNQAFHNEQPAYHRLPDSEPLIQQYMLLYDGKDLRHFLDEDRQWAAVYMRLHEHSSAKISQLIDETHRYLAADLPTTLTSHVTGSAVLVTNLIETLIRSQIQSLGLASVVIFAMVALFFRSIRTGLLAMPPNLLPILLNLGLMGWLGIPLDTATAMIAAVAIGIAVDDTVHLMSTYHGHLVAGASPPQAVRLALADKGRACIFTTLVITAAFAIVTVSRFLPTAHFGALSAMTMVFALLADLFFTPALLLTAPRLLTPRTRERCLLNP